MRMYTFTLPPSPLLPRRVVLLLKPRSAGVLLILIIRHVCPAPLGRSKRLLHRSPRSNGSTLLCGGCLGRPSQPRRQRDGTLDPLLLWHLERGDRLAHSDIGGGCHRLTHGHVGGGLIIQPGLHERVEQIGRLLLLFFDAAFNLLGLLDPTLLLDCAVLLCVAHLGALQATNALQCGAAQLALLVLDVVISVGSLGQTRILANLAELGSRGNLADIA